MTAREEKGASVTDGEEIFIYSNVEFIYLFVQYSSASRVRIFSWPCKGGGEGRNKTRNKSRPSAR